jgi:hypothetical protein
MIMKALEGRGVQLYSFLNLGARWGGWSVPCPSRLIPKKEDWYLLCRRLVSPRACLDACRKF